MAGREAEEGGGRARAPPAAGRGRGAEVRGLPPPALTLPWARPWG